MSKGSWREFDNSAVTAPFNSLLTIPRDQQLVRVKRIKSGKGGKIVTVISGLTLPPDEARSLLKIIKKTCGTGGTIKSDYLEVQGDKVKVVLNLLQQEGFCPKQSGG